MAGLRAGDPAAFDAVYAAYRPRVYGFLVRLTGRRELADELHQETWVRLARHAPRLAPDTRLAAWLFTVARNLWRSHQRWAWLDGTRLLELATRPAGATPTPLELATASESQRRAEAAIAALPAAYREVVLLVVVEHLDPAEAAVVLGLSPEATRQRLSRGRAALAAALGGAP